MNNMPGFAVSTLMFGPIASRSLGGIKQTATPGSMTLDGSKFFADNDGNIVFVEYSSGAIVSRHKGNISVRTANGDYWMGNTEGLWFRLD